MCLFPVNIPGWDHIDTSDCKCQVNISKYLQKSSLGTCEKEYLPQKPISASDVHPTREQKRLLSHVSYLPLTSTDHLSAAYFLHQLTHRHNLLTKDYSQTSSQQQSQLPDRPQKVIPCSQTICKHNVRCVHSSCPPVSQNTPLGDPLFGEISDLHMGVHVLTQPPAQKGSA